MVDPSEHIMGMPGTAPTFAAPSPRSSVPPTIPPAPVGGAGNQAPGADAGLAAACRRGEPGALEQLVERFQVEVFGTALRLVYDRDAALELTNSVFFKAHQNLHSYDPARPLRPWLLRIATNEALNWLRSQRREREHVLGGEARAAAFDQLSASAGAQADPEAAALAGERREAIHAALGRLPEHYRLVLILRFFNDLSYQEIAAHTGQDANTVGVQLLRARQLLKRELLDLNRLGDAAPPPAPAPPLPPGSGTADQSPTDDPSRRDASR